LTITLHFLLSVPLRDLPSELTAVFCTLLASGFGYSVIEKIDSEEMCNRYLTMCNGKRFGNVKSIMNIVTARVN
jgi:hypothetical protein